MTKKQILRSIAFCLAVCLVMVLLCDLFEQENYENHSKVFYTYRNYPSDTVDAVFIGTSGVGCYWIASQAYEDYGMTVYPLTSDALPCWLYINMIEEALKYQNPQLLLLDIRPFSQSMDDPATMDADARRVLDSMAFFSANRVKTALKTMEVMKAVDSEAPAFDISYLLSFVKYHTAWSGGEYSFANNLGQEPHSYAGFYAADWCSTLVEPQTPIVYDETYTEELDPVAEQALYDVLDYIREKGLNVLFVDTPQFAEGEKIGRFTQVYRILEEEGFDYLTFYNPDPEHCFTIDLDPETEFFNAVHVNYYGAQKFTAALSQYLKTGYDLPDRREDPRVRSCWDGVDEALKEYIRYLETAAGGTES